MSTFALLIFYIFDALRLHAKINTLSRQNARLKLQLFRHDKTAVPPAEILPLLLPSLQTELSDAFPLLSNYLQNIFIWLKKETKRLSHALSATPNKETLPAPDTMLLSLICAQCTAQLKYGNGLYIYRGTLNTQGQEMLRLWNYLTDKLEKANYYSPQEAQQLREEIKEIIQTNG